MNNTVIWTSYVNEHTFNEYIIKENDNTKTFCTGNLFLKEDNINYLNEYFGELCTMYYVWKHRKSENVGFQHYRFLLTDIDVHDNILVEASWPGQIYKYFLESGLSEHTIIESLNYLSKYSNIKLSDIINILIDEDAFVFHANTFCCPWYIFDDMCNFIFGFLDYLFPNESWKDSNTLYEYINNCYILYKNNTKHIINDGEDWSLVNFDNDKRYFAFLFEFLIPLFFNVKYKDKLVHIREKRNWRQKAIILDLHNSNENIELFKKCHHKNIFTGIKVFKIINYQNTLLYDKYKEDPLFTYHYKWTEFSDETNIDIDNIWNYKISVDEYIDVESPYDFFKTNSYKILKLT